MIELRSEPRTPFSPLLAIYGDPDTAAVFSETQCVESWLKVERALASAQAELGLIPTSAAVAIQRAARVPQIDFARLREETEAVGYPIISLLDQTSADTDPEVAEYLHWGATTQDIMDTGLVLQLQRACKRIDVLLRALGRELCDLADTHRATVMSGRTHAQMAVPTTLGAKMAVWLDEIARHVERLTAAERRTLVVQLFGAAGTAAALGPRSAEVRASVAQRLAIGYVDVPWHSSRDRVAELGFVLAATAATCGKVAREVIELSRNEIGEFLERGPARHGASSTMPQKQNPSRCEAVVAMSALARQHAATLLSAMLGTHERSAGEWQTEWDTLPALCTLTAGCLHQIRLVLSTAQAVPARMRANLDLDGGLVMAEAVMMALAPELGRSRAHEIVSRACGIARENGQPLAEVLSHEPFSATIPPKAAVFDPETYLGEAHAIVASAVKRWIDTEQRGHTHSTEEAT
jgi:3-carboxy-cis,cis-muconate cycloisomerase